MNDKENWLRAVQFRYPEWIPCGVNCYPVVWKTYRNELEKIVLAHPRIFPDYVESSRDFDWMPLGYSPGDTFTDNWGCVWVNAQEGVEGQVVVHPLADWSALATYRMPDPMTQEDYGERDWAKYEQSIGKAKQQAKLTWGLNQRLCDRLYFLRGFENLMMDFATEPPELSRLLEMFEEREMRIVRRLVEIGVDIGRFHTDIGHQTGLMISPAKFRKYIKPMFARLFRPFRDAGSVVRLSSDGRLLEIVDDLIECGVSLHDPQLGANTLQEVARAYKGKLCANVVLDIQSLPFMTPTQVRDHIKEVIDLMALPEGGLMLAGGAIGVETPLSNIDAMCDAMEDYCFP